MASVSKRVQAGKITYIARWRDDQGKQCKQSFTRKIDAKAHAARMEAAVTDGSYVDTRNTLSLSEACWAWLDRRTVRRSTREGYAGLIRNHVDATPIGARRLVEIKNSDVQKWVSDRGAHLGPATMRKLVRVMRAVFADAVIDRLVSANPVVRVSVAPVAQDRVVPLSVKQVQALADAAEGIAGRYRAMILTQAGLGLRLGELLGLRVCDVDFTAHTVTIGHQPDRKGRALVPPKTDSSRRTIPLPGLVADALKAHLAAFPPSAPVGCECPAGAKCARQESGLIFHTEAGRPMDDDFYGRVFRRAVERAGLPDGSTTHDMRHHFASVLLAAGVPAVAVATWMGHRNAMLVHSVYGHMMPRSDNLLRSAMDGAWSAASALDVPYGEAGGAVTSENAA